MRVGLYVKPRHLRTGIHEALAEGIKPWAGGLVWLKEVGEAKLPLTGYIPKGTIKGGISRMAAAP